MRTLYAHPRSQAARAAAAAGARNRDAVDLELRPAEQDVEVVSGAATFHIRTLRAEDFPPLPEPGGENVVEVPRPRATRRTRS